jgi:uncharacterized OB-fold protein
VDLEEVTVDAQPVDDQDVVARFPGQWVDRDNVHFFRGMLEQRLLVNRCRDCANWYQPPWPRCPRCWSADVVPTEVSGRGTLRTFTVPHPKPDTIAGLGVIDLVEQEGLRASTVVVGCEAEDLRIGMPVELTWVDRDGRPVPAFRPAGVA